MWERAALNSGGKVFTGRTEGPGKQACRRSLAFPVLRSHDCSLIICVLLLLSSY